LSHRLIISSRSKKKK